MSITTATTTFCYAVSSAFLVISFHNMIQERMPYAQWAALISIAITVLTRSMSMVLCILFAMVMSVANAQTDIPERVDAGICRTGFVFEVPTGAPGVQNSRQDVPTDTAANVAETRPPAPDGLHVVVLDQETAAKTIADLVAALQWWIQWDLTVQQAADSGNRSDFDAAVLKNKDRARIREKSQKLIEAAKPLIPPSYLGGRL